MGFALLNYNIPANGVNAVNTDATAAVDQDFTQRNGHYVLFEPYRLGGVMPVGASITRGRFQIPGWNAVGEVNMLSANRSLQPPSNPQWDLYLDFPPPLPMGEEVQLQLSNNLGAGTEIENAGILVLTPDWKPTRPQGLATFIIRASFTVTPILNAWSGPQTIALSASLRGGVYAVVGAACQGTNACFFRIIFPRYRLYLGRKLRPGMPVQNAIGDVLSNQFNPWQVPMGEWGRFHSLELPQVEIFGTLAGSITYQLFMHLVYLGDNPALLNGGMGGGDAGFGVVQANPLQGALAS